MRLKEIYLNQCLQLFLQPQWPLIFIPWSRFRFKQWNRAEWLTCCSVNHNVRLVDSNNSIRWNRSKMLKQSSWSKLMSSSGRSISKSRLQLLSIYRHKKSKQTSHSDDLLRHLTIKLKHCFKFCFFFPYIFLISVFCWQICKFRNL